MTHSIFNMLTSEQIEDLNHAVLEYIAAIFPSAVPVRQVHRKVIKEIGFDLQQPDVERSLEFLKGLKFTEFKFDDLGSSRFWSATSEGVLHYEREQK